MAFRVRAGVAMAAVLAAFALGAAGAEAPVVLKKSPSLSKGVDAFPRLAGTSAQVKTINAALDRADGRMRRFLADCKDNGQTDRWDFARHVSAPMKGPGFLSLYAADDFFCGGAHPNTYQLALTYDLATGKPITWAKYLPARLVTPEDRATADDGTIVGVVQAPALLEWYRAEAVRQRGAPDECKDVIADIGSLVLWIDAKAGGVAMQPEGLPHVIAACGETVVMSAAELRRQGASPKLVAAIEAAHRARSWSE